VLSERGEYLVKVGILADTHDNVPMIAKAVAVFTSMGAEALVHAGDFIAPFAVKRLVEFDGEIHAVYGNNDGEKAGIAKILPTVEEPPAEFALGGVSFCLVHDIAAVDDIEALEVDVVVYGHTHKRREARAGDTLVINPGEAGGWLHGVCEAALLDTDNLRLERILLTDPRS